MPWKCKTKKTWEIHDSPRMKCFYMNFHIIQRAWFQAMHGSTAKLYKILFAINTNSISQRAEKLTISAELEMIDWSLC